MRHSSNHQSALLAATIVEQKLCHEISLGCVADPFQEIPFPNFQSSPLGLVPKHDPGKLRLIHDLSFPKGDSINVYTSKEFTTVQYDIRQGGGASQVMRSLLFNCWILKHMLICMRGKSFFTLSMGRVCSCSRSFSCLKQLNCIQTRPAS